MAQSALKLVGKEDGDKQRALEAALAQIDRAFGKGSVMKLGEKGKIVDGDQIMALIGTQMAADGSLRGGGVVAGSSETHASASSASTAALISAISRVALRAPAASSEKLSG